MGEAGCLRGAMLCRLTSGDFLQSPSEGSNRFGKAGDLILDPPDAVFSRWSARPAVRDGRGVWSRDEAPEGVRKHGKRFFQLSR